MEDKLGCARAFLTHSCTAALEMAAILCDIEPGDEVIIPSFTFVSTANAFVLRGAIPVFVDIRSDTLTLDERKIESAITPKTRTIVPVHYAGIPCVMEKIMEIADSRGLWVVEDAAQALLSTHKERFLGTIGHLGCLSFHETKNIISGEGGALLVNDSRFIERAEIVREKGTNRGQFFRGEVDKYTWVDIGSSFLPSEEVGPQDQQNSGGATAIPWDSEAYGSGLTTKDEETWDYTTYNLGLGYYFTENLQFDLMFSGNAGYVNSDVLFASFTIIFP